VVSVRLEGVDALARALDDLRDRAGVAAGDAVDAMANVAKTAIRTNLNLTSHPPGTPTPSPPGSPPSRITGALDDSVRETLRHHEPSVGHAENHVAPTMIYSRIQELGGWTGAGHRSFLPPRPYVRPALEAARLKLERAAEDAFRNVVER
jgi:phage gpG-like protein